MLNLAIATIFMTIFSIPTDAQSKERSLEMLNYAMERVNNEDYLVAEETLDKLLSFENGNTDALFLRGYCRYKQEEYEKAKLDLDKVIKIDKLYTNAYIIRGRVNRALGNYWASLRDYNKARKLDPYRTFFSVTKGVLGD